MGSRSDGEPCVSAVLRKLDGTPFHGREGYIWSYLDFPEDFFPLR